MLLQHSCSGLVSLRLLSEVAERVEPLGPGAELQAVVGLLVVTAQP